MIRRRNRKNINDDDDYYSWHCGEHLEQSKSADCNKAEKKGGGEEDS